MEAAFIAGAAALVLRWALWPWEVHACHRHPRWLIVGFTAAVLVVAAPVFILILFTQRIFV